VNGDRTGAVNEWSDRSLESERRLKGAAEKARPSKWNARGLAAERGGVADPWSARSTTDGRFDRSENAERASGEAASNCGSKPRSRVSPLLSGPTHTAAAVRY